VKSLAGN